jgi:hypothetical protein
MAAGSLKDRVATLEAEMARLKVRVETIDAAQPQWKNIVGVFADDPAFTEAMRLGREYRESLRPASRKRRKR